MRFKTTLISLFLSVGVLSCGVKKPPLPPLTEEEKMEKTKLEQADMNNAKIKNNNKKPKGSQPNGKN